MTSLAAMPLLIINDFGMRKLPLTAAEDLLEIIMRRYERASTLLTSNRAVEDWGKVLGDTAAVSSMLESLVASRSSVEVRPAQLAHKNCSAFAGVNPVRRSQKGKSFFFTWGTSPKIPGSQSKRLQSLEFPVFLGSCGKTPHPLPDQRLTNSRLFLNAQPGTSLLRARWFQLHGLPSKKCLDSPIFSLTA